MNKHMMENATTGQQRQFLLASLPLKWPLLVPKRPSSTRMAKPTKNSWYPAGIGGDNHLSAIEKELLSIVE